jgi:2-oxoglutarate dehydrogenase E1 component
VNGEDPEAVAQVVRLAMDFRLEFKRDVVINMYGYRRLGHNEGDEPAFTQPVLYHAIARRKSVREGYLEHLLKLGEVTLDEANAIAAKRRELLEKELTESQSPKPQGSVDGRGIWSKFKGGPEPAEDTGWAPLSSSAGEGRGEEAKISRTELAHLLEIQTTLPADFHPHLKIKKWLEARAHMAAGKEPLDWSAAESLALASLASEGIRVRLSGQDSERGTFSQRHAILHDFEDGHTYMPLSQSSSFSKSAPAVSPSHPAEEGERRPSSRSTINQQPSTVEIFNSPLSEVSVLGFEYGYSLDYPDALILWEAQYGDFWNAAQPIVDQFIASAEDKWQRLSGLVLLLPHGMEGQGPEHSSARLERFLHLFAEDNLQVVYPTTPAQYFHCLRRQAVRSWRKPLIVMTPKSLLRHPKVVSSLDDCATGSFQRILADAAGKPAAEIKRVLLCAGKIYYELEAFREESKREDVAIIRIEQLAPLPAALLEQTLSSYREGTPVSWVQEEPANMGAWMFLRVRFGEKLFNRFPFAGITRPASASPATGSHKRHKQEQAEIIQRAFA